MNLAIILEDSAQFFPEKIAIIEDGKTYTYREFNEYSNRIASILTDYGVQPGDYVGFCAPNSYDWVALYFGALKCGAVAVTFSYLLTKYEFQKILIDCKPRVLFTTEERLPDMEYTESTYRPDLVITEKGANSCKKFSEKGNPAYINVDRERDDIAAILYTGGTTGSPKGAMLSHENILYPISNVARYERSSEKDVTLCFLPLNHVFGQMHVLNATIYSSGAIVIQPSFNMDSALEAVERYNVTKFFAVPTIYIRMLQIPDLKDKFESVTYCFSAAASMAAEVVREWKAKTGLDIHESYGLTESASIVTFNHYHRHVIGSVGTPANLMEIQIRDRLG
ncbi:MAG: AMP-binding protein, partial [Deltaproteobacteria bacterium]|nr:AMP-binding protein [Deltaproteobacteria bacterium]